VATSKSFNDLLNDAINDMVEHGFDSVERAAYWQAQLSAAAEREFRSQDELDRIIREAMAAVYRRLIERGVILKDHPGVERFTIDMVRPAARAELDKRILAAADLIKLNREEMRRLTLRRFAGWATSIPPGGVSEKDKRKTSQHIKQPMQSAPFEERRVLIDQGHKLRNSVSTVIAMDGQALAGIWRSHWRQAGYNYRPDHKDRDLLVYAVPNNWAIQAGLMKKGPNPYFDQITAPAQEPFCRCYWTWIYNLDALPVDMLTALGVKRLAEATALLNA